MPNWCFGEVQVKGTQENKNKFYNLFLTNNQEENANKKRYFARTWISSEITEHDNNTSSFFIECAWSVYSCMVDGYPNEYEDHECPTIFEVSKELELEIQIASEEGGCCFREFYHIKNGEVIEQQCEDFPEGEYDEEELYEKYCEENQNPKSFDEWCDLEYQELRDAWYWEVYNKLTLV